MSISGNIQKKSDDIHDEREVSGMNGEIAKEVRTKAMKAILGGPEDWKEYVQLFATNDEELARLIPTDGTHNDEKKNIARAYLAANGMCAPGTGDNLPTNVTTDLDLP